MKNVILAPELEELIKLQTITEAQAQDYQRHANRVARTAGYGRATSVVFGLEERVISHTRHGYIKNTTGEYVSNAYRYNFGWKNTSYCYAETVVQLTI